ncbi:MAG: two pore domain potassium channel family protein [Castellaniella sp.]|uniref:two pore domain potassium channel family protein n=1 Tax=Castellaniella sp. TaxID=1955812 RepID=UPI002A35F1E7|nr:two pore domain potassium channel family protein [Castellaniella sp.]MDY0310360.1 two pore domain potassium channel family protein [Castellaniella sp.]
MYESRNEPLLHPAQFRRRMLRHVGYALLLVAVTLLVGALGGHYLGGHTWHDAWMSAAFVIGGIGTYVLPDSSIGKAFSAVYGFFVGLVVMATLGVVLAPIAHRIMHKFHLDETDD